MSEYKTSLGAYLRYLKTSEPAPLPDREAWSDMIRRTTAAGAACEVSEDTFDYFLDVLPPRWMGREGFAFGEGMDDVRLFWKSAEKFFSRQLTCEEHETFCRLTGIGLTSG